MDRNISVVDAAGESLILDRARILGLWQNRAEPSMTIISFEEREIVVDEPYEQLMHRLSEQA